MLMTKSKQAHVTLHSPAESHLFSKKKECDNTLCKWQTSFANSLKKGYYFLNFEDEKERVIKPTYAKGGLCVRGHSRIA